MEQQRGEENTLKALQISRNIRQKEKKKFRGDFQFFFLELCDLCDPSTINVASASLGSKPLWSSRPSQAKWRQMILAWITKLEITFQLPGDSLIKNPLAGSTQQ